MRALGFRYKIFYHIRFSMELLLSYIEFTNFQQHLKDKYNVDKSLIESEEHVLLEFPPNVPCSSIVANQWALSISDPLHDPKTKAYKLYCKYVQKKQVLSIS